MMKVPFEKPFLSFEQQAEKLAGLLGANSSVPEIQSVLKNINYYKIGLYVYPFRINSAYDALVENTDFSHILSLYKFDKKLSLVILDGLRTLETAMKTQMAYNLGKIDPFFFYNTENNDYILSNKMKKWRNNSDAILGNINRNQTNYIGS